MKEKEDTPLDTLYDKDHLKEAKAILVGVFRKAEEEPLALDHLEELDLLAQTHKITVVERVCTLLRDFSAATFLSQGKLQQLLDKVRERGANLIIFDDEISPVQQRNLEKFFRLPVMDRTEVILGVFADRARTREAKLQIELAQMKYLSPRLKRMWLHLSRQHGGGGGGSGGGGGYLRGTGEKQIEVDRRLIKKRLEHLGEELKKIAQYRQTQKRQREKNAVPVFAIIGYTNAGKSTLMNRLTSADVLVENMLFATLDTTTRHFVLPNRQKVLITDTVGFIRKLPHLLVAAFKSTLEEAFQADVLIHLIDSSHPRALEQAKTTFDVLAELQAKERPIITVINKCDVSRQTNASMIQKLRLTYPRSIQISALTGEGLPELFAEMERVVQDFRKRVTLKIPQSEYHLMAIVLREGTVHSKEYEDNQIVVDVELPRVFAEQLSQYCVGNPP